MYGLTAADLDLQGRARAFADELIPHEQHAEEHGGELRRGVAERTTSGLSSSASTPPTCPPSVGGRGCTTLQQVLVQEQARSGHQRHRLVHGDAARVVARRRQRPPARDAGCCRRCAARRRSATRSPRSTPARRLRPRGDRAPRRRRLRARRGEVARHVVPRGRLRLLPGGADRRSARRRPGPVRASTRTRRACASSAPRRTRTRWPRPPDRGLRGRAGPGDPAGRHRGGRHVLRLRVVPVRAADGRRPVPRGRGAAGGRGDRVRRAARRRRTSR